MQPRIGESIPISQLNPVSANTVQQNQIKVGASVPVSQLNNNIGQNENQSQPNNQQQNDLLNNPITRGIQAIFPGKTIGQDIGTLAGAAYTKVKDLITGSHDYQNYDLSAPSPLQALGDTAQGALMVAAPGVGEEAGIGTKIAANAALGAGFGATGAVANGSTDLGDIGKQTAFGALAGGAAGTVAEGVSKLADKLPSRIINNLLPQLKNPETIDYAINNLKLGSTDTMVKASQDAMKSYNSQIQAILQHPDYAGITVKGDDVINKTLEAFPNSEYTPEQILNKVKSQIPGSGALVTKLQNQGLSLEQANSLRQAIDSVTYKSKIDSPEIKAGKELASQFANGLRNTVKTEAPETVPVFDNFSKEINLNKALVKMQINRSKQGIVKFKDLLGALGAGSIFGPVGGVATLGIEKAADTPMARVGAAKLIDKAAPLINSSATAGKLGGALLGKIPVTNQDN